MDVEQVKKDEDLSHWFSTYGLITAERILGRYRIILPQDLLMAAVKNPLGFYHKILQVPLKNVLNGIILEQASDYHVYAQKIFIDYLLSGDSSSPEGSQGENTRIALEEERKGLIVLGDNFHELEVKHGNLIASSQTLLIHITDEWNTTLDAVIQAMQNALRIAGNEAKPSEIRLALNHALSTGRLHESGNKQLDAAFLDTMNVKLKAPQMDSLKQSFQVIMADLVTISEEFEGSLSDLFYQTKELNEQVTSFRTQFYETILRVVDLIKLLPEYKIDPVQDAVNRESLYFDKSIGESVG